MNNTENASELLKTFTQNELTQISAYLLDERAKESARIQKQMRTWGIVFICIPLLLGISVGIMRIASSIYEKMATANEEALEAKELAKDQSLGLSEQDLISVAQNDVGIFNHRRVAQKVLDDVLSGRTPTKFIGNLSYKGAKTIKGENVYFTISVSGTNFFPPFSFEKPTIRIGQVNGVSVPCLKGVNIEARREGSSKAAQVAWPDELCSDVFSTTNNALAIHRLDR